MAKLTAAQQHRLTVARNDRAKHQGAINDFLRLADPVRPRVGDNSSTVRSDEADELFDATLQEVAEDFASDLIHRAMPREGDWVKYEPEVGVDQAVQAALRDPLKKRTEAIFGAVRSSNFYSEAGSEWAFDMGHGTGAMICNDYGAGEPFCFEAIGPHQLLIERGAKGKLGLQGREFQLTIEDAFAQWPKADWPAELRRKLNNETARRSSVTCLEFAERIWDPGDEMWRWTVAVDGHVIASEKLVGRGSCPIIVTRWRSVSSTAWGIGPLRKALANGKSLDQVAYLRLASLGKGVNPPTVYDDDGVLNPEGGVGAGMWIPRVPGSRIDQLESAQLEWTYYEAGQLQDAVRRAGFQSGPRQEGKTPPTAFQWREEQIREGRRLEQPTGKLYEEGVIAILDRVEYLLVKRGTIQPILNVERQLIRVRPQNPLAKQQDGEKVQNAMNVLSMARSVLDPQVIAASVDTRGTLENMKNAVDDTLIVLRDPQQADEMMRGVLGQPDMGEGLETAPAGAPA
ncbi:MAG: hypothetical protein IOB84_13680 [Brevundimonas sp.]|nr:hypothetical protein [Brevundimonas sp.]